MGNVILNLIFGAFVTYGIWSLLMKIFEHSENKTRDRIIREKTEKLLKEQKINRQIEISRNLERLKLEEEHNRIERENNDAKNILIQEYTRTHREDLYFKQNLEWEIKKLERTQTRPGQMRKITTQDLYKAIGGTRKITETTETKQNLIGFQKEEMTVSEIYWNGFIKENEVFSVSDTRTTSNTRGGGLGIILKSYKHRLGISRNQLFGMHVLSYKYNNAKSEQLDYNVTDYNKIVKHPNITSFYDFFNEYLKRGGEFEDLFKSRDTYMGEYISQIKFKCRYIYIIDYETYLDLRLNESFEIIKRYNNEEIEALRQKKIKDYKKYMELEQKEDEYQKALGVKENLMTIKHIAITTGKKFPHGIPVFEVIVDNSLKKGYEEFARISKTTRMK